MERLHSLARALLIGYVCLVIAAAAVIAGLWKLGHLRLLSVQTDSMAPVYRPGDALLVGPASELRPGEIVSYMSPTNPGVIISHRLVSVDNLLVTKGDNLPKPDVAFSETLVVGRAAASLPRLGYVLDFLHKPIGVALSVYLPASALVIAEIRRLSRYFGRGYYRLFGFR